MRITGVTGDYCASSFGEHVCFFVNDKGFHILNRVFDIYYYVDCKSLEHLRLS